MKRTKKRANYGARQAFFACERPVVAVAPFFQEYSVLFHNKK